MIAWMAGVGIVLRNVRSEPFYLRHPLKKWVACVIAEANANVAKR
jgi:hypothetical protein